MRTVIVYHSHSGHTRALAERVRDETGGDLEVKPTTPYGLLSVYSRGGRRAVNGEADAIEPPAIDVSAYDRIVIGTPVWGPSDSRDQRRRCRPAGRTWKERGPLCHLRHRARRDPAVLRAALAARGIEVVGEVSFARKELGDTARIGTLVDAVRSGGSA